MMQQLHRLSGLHHPSIPHHRDAVRYGGDHGHIVRDEHIG